MFERITISNLSNTDKILFKANLKSQQKSQTLGLIKSKWNHKHIKGPVLACHFSECLHYIKTHLLALLQSDWNEQHMINEMVIISSVIKGKHFIEKACNYTVSFQNISSSVLASIKTIDNDSQ